MTDELVPAPAPGVEKVELESGPVIVSLAGSLLRLSETAAVVWECLPEGGDVDGLVGDLAEAFGAPADVVGVDVRRFLRSLRDLGLADEGAGVDASDPDLAPRSKPYYLDTEPSP